LFKVISRLAPGALLYGSSCTSDLRDTLMAAGLDFVENSAEEVLGTFIPISAILAGIGGA
jgi:hypothetical protein